jgi:hypothetical protein
MTQAIVKVPFDGVADGQIMPTKFKPGDEVEGKLAQVALDAG